MYSVLLVDDEPLVRATVSRVLRAAGYVVIEATNGDQAQDWYRQQRPDVVILDLFMPGKDGLQVLRELRAEVPQPKVVVMSGGGTRGITETLDVARAMGAHHVLTKPVPREELLEVVAGLVPARD